MKLLVTLAWRNVWRNRRRSVLTILGIIFATTLTVFFRGFATGTWDYNIRNSVEMFSGYLQVQRTGYQENPSLTKSVPYTTDLFETLTRTPGITAFAPRIQADGLVSFRQHSTGAMLLGLDPTSEVRLSRFHKRIVAGRFFAAGSPDEVVLGETLLGNLGAEIGDTLVILAQGHDGVLGNLKFRIAGVLRMGVPQFDAAAVLLDLGAARELLAMEGRVSVVALSIEELGQLEQVRSELAAAIDDQHDKTLTVLTWKEVMPELSQAMEFDLIGDWFFLGILIIVVAFGIMNTVLMSVTERFREFGVALAIGMRSSRLVALVVMESAMLTLIGVSIGTALGQGLNLWIERSPIQLGGQYEEIYAQYGFLPQLVATSSPALAANVAGVLLLICALAVIYPAYRTYRLEPLKGIRHT